MDRGPLEREKAEAIKAEIARAGGKRRRISVSHKPLSPQPSLKSPSGDSFGPRRPSTGRFDGVALQNTPETTPKSLLYPQVEDTQSLTDYSFGLISPGDELWTDDMINWQDQVLPIRLDDGKSTVLPPRISSHVPSLDQCSISGELSLQGLRSPLPVVQNERHLSGNMGQTVNGGMSTYWERIGFQTDSVFTTTNSPGVVHRGLDDLLPGLSGNSSSTSSLDLTISSRKPNLQTAVMLSYYLNKVLLEQFRFSSNTNIIGQLWLQVLIYSSEHLLEITLILSQAHYIWESNPDFAKTYETDLSKAMRILRTLHSPNTMMRMLDKEQRAMQAVVACACFHQVICLELLYGGNSHWQQCLTQAGPYTQILIDIVVRGGIDANQSEPLSLATEQTLLAAAKTLLARLIWLDIMAAVSTGSRSYLKTNHSYLLSLEFVDMAEVFGCENWVVKELHEIISLHEWKKQAEAEQNLNIMQLATHGAAILQSLKEQIAQLGDTRPKTARTQAGGANDNHSSNCTKYVDRYMAKCITATYAQAATIFLHVVLSGPLPYLQEIQAAQAELRSSLDVLASKKLTGYVAWPLCVAACFATDDEQDPPLSPASLEVHGNPKMSKVCIEALNIGQKCRSIRKGGESAEWISAMKSLQTCILLA
ncbi:fungal-specific transcription factor domain-containing protein [Truncatella angustata]|uniref:Fungal-specific transcription factor domain-containing protein n=1 Tax=Truncatella angustata TaxID=152316 RepID=A0A9P8UVX9_9PEZI|nr:fungal-specific transcription factor domain-containing protein [Truncatella angustata]KAH6659516.1 fungal-specific transcription factor domain-containing protein [Truncatella angustata]